jgi:hypothetical protein
MNIKFEIVSSVGPVTVSNVNDLDALDMSIMRLPVHMFTLPMVVPIPFTSIQLFVFWLIIARGSHQGLLQLPIVDRTVGRSVP